MTNFLFFQKSEKILRKFFMETYYKNELLIKTVLNSFLSSI